MKRNFHVKQVNSPFEDTAFFLRNVYHKHAFLLDCGRIGGLTNAEVLSISDIFVSHTHIDHFYGFDRIIRGTLRTDKTIRVFGPPGIIRNVEGKLNAYTWNLIQDYTLAFEVIELEENVVTYNRCIFKASNSFSPEPDTIPASVIDLGEGFTLDFRHFDHGIPSIGYRIRESQHINIRKDTISSHDLKAGPWVSDLKARLRRDAPRDDTIVVTTRDGHRHMTVGELEELLVVYNPPQDVTYITDTAPTAVNIEKAVDFARDSHLLLIEAMFIQEDAEHATEKRHLTVTDAKRIFTDSNSQLVKFFHFAPKYDRMKDVFFSELTKGLSGKFW